ncbi:hypothetical protein GEO21_22355 [Sphingobacterium faecium]|uniref:hypothetical protein n=1 Tax=Sphingobacterium faecium TaxID=34087 RepID=UPI001292A992|nr:hypothetical protein [Sphingobacterium faecium]MQP30230.1 hypothetical protein [Sphingobacterium faecium]
MAKQSSARQQSLDFLDNLGESENNFRDVSSGLESVAGQFINRVIDNINGYDLIDSGKISDLSIEVVSDKEVNILGQTYINYIDDGVQGKLTQSRAPLSPYKYTDKMPPVQTFVQWIKSKNIKVRNTSKVLGTGNDTVIDVEDDDKEIKKVAYAMALDRFQHGAEPKPIFKKEIPKMIDDAVKVVGQITIDNIFSNLNLK